MLIFIQNAILWTLALYGLFEIIKTIIYYYTYKGHQAEGIQVIIAAKNQERNIEGFLRAIIYKVIYGKGEIIKKIIVTDLNSEDKTKEILERLAKDNSCVEFMEVEKFLSYCSKQ